MFIAVLIVLNLPVFLFLGWLAFDSAGRAADTVVDTIVAIIKQICIPWGIRELIGMDTTDSVGILPIGGYLFACGFLVYGEHWVLKWLGWI